MTVFDSSFLKFFAVGIMSTAINFLSLFFLLDVFSFGQLVSVTISYVFATLFHFFSNKIYSFQVCGSVQLGQVYRYLSVSLLNYLVTVFIVKIFVVYLSFSVYIGLIASVGATFLIGYRLSKYWIFNKGALCEE